MQGPTSLNILNYLTCIMVQMTQYMYDACNTLLTNYYPYQHIFTCEYFFSQCMIMKTHQIITCKRTPQLWPEHWTIPLSFSTCKLIIVNTFLNVIYTSCSKMKIHIRSLRWSWWWIMYSFYILHTTVFSSLIVKVKQCEIVLYNT